MKKNLFILAAAAVALASCSSDDTIAESASFGAYQKEISLFALTQPNTRATVHGTAFPDQDIYVAAYKAAPATAGNYFVKTAFKKNWQGGSASASDDIWGGDPARFWPLSPATINFLAATGTSVTATHFTFNETNYANDVTVAYTSANSYNKDSQSDIMYAVGQGVVTQDDNTLTFAGGGTGENVGMTFYHALALLNFQVKANSTTEVGKIKVNSITVNGASYTGSLKVTNANYAATTTDAKNQPTIAWTPDATTPAAVSGTSSYAFPYTLASKDDYLPTNTVADPQTWWNIMIVPGNTTDATVRGFRSFTINYTVTDLAGQPDQTYNYTYYPSGDEDTDTNVEQGKIYTYKINFKLHEIRIQPSVTDWTAPASYPKEITIQD